MTGWLTGTLFATSLLIAMVLMIREPVRRHFGSRIAYGLWLIPAARLFMPVLTTTMVRPVPTIVSPTGLVLPNSAESLLLTSVNKTPPSLIDQLGGWGSVTMVVWLAGAMLLLVSRLVAYVRARRAILTDAVELARIGNVRLVRSPHVTGPVAFGLFHRMIAVPTDFDRRFGDRERCLALEHELSHHRSGDLFANTFAFVLLCLQWFNPLAWVAHGAFRFDQEAACDARVLDKAKADDRADYGRAIAKAASGRGLLFLAALDHRSSLQRRLESMLTPSTPSRRIVGRVLLATAVVVALPLTASRAIAFVDQPTQVEPVAPEAPLPSETPVAPYAPQAPLPPQPPKLAVAQHGKGAVWIKGKQMDFEKMTPEQRNEVRRQLGEARAELARNEAEANADIAKARAEIASSDGDIAKAKAEAETEIANALREIDANASEIRKAGQDPERIKAQVRASLANIDFAKIRRDALASVDERTISDSIRQAEKSIAEVEAQLDAADRN